MQKCKTCRVNDKGRNHVFSSHQNLGCHDDTATKGDRSGVFAAWGREELGISP